MGADWNNNTVRHYYIILEDVLLQSSEYKQAQVYVLADHSSAATNLHFDGGE